VRKSRIQNPESKSQNNQAEAASTDFVFLFFWILDSSFMKTILVIEDDEVARELMRMALERRGYRVMVAEDGIQGYEAAVRERPDLIITDIKMPAADGVHLVRRVRDTTELAATPILVTTGFGSGSATFALAQGATAYEPKPINPENFMATVKRLLDQGEG
jgi:two-component system chemotaxis response regulator CheY